MMTSQDIPNYDATHRTYVVWNHHIIANQLLYLITSEEQARFISLYEENNYQSLDVYASEVFEKIRNNLYERQQIYLEREMDEIYLSALRNCYML